MKKKSIIIAVSCLVAGAIGFAGVAATEKAQERRMEISEQESSQTTEPASGIVEPRPNKETKTQEKMLPTESKTPEKSSQEETDDEEKVQQTAQEMAPELEEYDMGEEEARLPVAKVTDALHFAEDTKILWPVKGNVLLNYSMDSTIYFPTLDQYRYNPALVIAGNVNDSVTLVAKGIITDISTSEETGCTVTQDLGDGYVAIYGQLKDLNFEKGATVEAGQVIGYIAEPTKYYSTEGSNVYFCMEKDGQPVNPLDFLE